MFRYLLFLTKGFCNWEEWRMYIEMPLVQCCLYMALIKNNNNKRRSCVILETSTPLVNIASKYFLLTAVLRVTLFRRLRLNSTPRKKFRILLEYVNSHWHHKLRIILVYVKNHSSNHVMNLLCISIEESMNILIASFDFGHVSKNLDLETVMIMMTRGFFFIIFKCYFTFKIFQW